jgi:hypothetical protein
VCKELQAAVVAQATQVELAVVLEPQPLVTVTAAAAVTDLPRLEGLIGLKMALMIFMLVAAAAPALGAVVRLTPVVAALPDRALPVPGLRVQMA